MTAPPKGVLMLEAATTGEAPWPERQPLPKPPAVPTLPAEMVPRPLRGWLIDAAERASLPLEMLAAPALVAAGAVVGRTVGIAPEAVTNPWTVVPNLWGAIVARPGLLKSHAISEAVAAIRPLEAEAREAFRRAADEHEVERLAVAAELAVAKKGRRGVVDRDAIAQLLEKQREPGPAERRYTTSDATVEKLGELLADNPRGLLLLRDEVTGLLANFERPGREGERSFFLEAWNGTGSFTFDRIGRGTVHVPSMTISMFGSIQPAKLAPLIGEALAGGGDGLLQRFGLLVWPDDLPPYRRAEGRPDAEAREIAFTVFRRLDALAPGAVGATLTGTAGIPCLAFRPDAQELFDTWRSELEVRLRSDELQRTPTFCSHLSKYRSLMPSLALLFHLLEAVDGGGGGNVPEAAVRLAAAWCEYLERHARKLYRRELEGETEAARLLAAKLEAGEVVHGELVREVYRKGWAGLRTPEAVYTAAAVLERLGWVRVVEVATGGRPSCVLELHPDLRGAR